MLVISDGVATLASGAPPAKSLHRTFTSVGVEVTAIVLVGVEQPCWLYWLVPEIGMHRPGAVESPPLAMIHPAGIESFKVATPRVRGLVPIDPEILKEMPLYLEASTRLQPSK